MQHRNTCRRPTVRCSENLILNFQCVAGRGASRRQSWRQLERKKEQQKKLLDPVQRLPTQTATWDVQSLFGIMRHKYKRVTIKTSNVLRCAMTHAMRLRSVFTIHISKATESLRLSILLLSLHFTINLYQQRCHHHRKVCTIDPIEGRCDRRCNEER